MITLQAVLNELKNDFKQKNIDTFSLDAQLIVMKVMEISKIKLLTYPELEVSKAQYSAIKKLADERMTYKPMQYILGECEFMGLDFYVNEHTLIPRGDTEILVETAIATIKDSGFNSVLDIGTGSGAIAVSIAKYTDTDVTAVDISGDALDIAKKNSDRHRANVKFVKSDLFDKVEGKFDIIVSNPPYIETEVIDSLEPQVKDFEPITALDGGKDGLIFYKKIVQNCHKYLNTGGYLMFEIGYNQAEAVSSIMENADFSEIEVKKDLAGLDRLVIGKKIC